MQKIRTYHTTLAILSILSYITGEWGVIHSWLGYGVAITIAFRLLWALGGNPHVGLMRFYPSFEGLKLDNALTHPSITKIFMLGIAVSLLGVVGTGIALDGGKDIGLANAEFVGSALADDNKHGDESHKGFFSEALEEGHELFANLMLFFVGLHVSYLLMFKLPLAKFMLFLNKPSK